MEGILYKHICDAIAEFSDTSAPSFENLCQFQLNLLFPCQEINPCQPKSRIGRPLFMPLSNKDGFGALNCKCIRDYQLAIKGPLKGMIKVFKEYGCTRFANLISVMS